ncbi:MAG TPA: hypothetical protein VIL85_25820 [Thermomicrobiales bacterium]|jgi:hypothetical protein
MSEEREDPPASEPRVARPTPARDEQPDDSFLGEMPRKPTHDPRRRHTSDPRRQRPVGSREQRPQ